ncbi:glycosyltransferase [Aestuariibius insulae]|uniref:glycosyltransferase n=1 Tax=Aestuariibius insulae TaxID=2058287 RepID=UPI00345EB7C0
MLRFSDFAQSEPALSEPPEEVVCKIQNLANGIHDPSEARLALDQLMPDLRRYRPDPRLFLPAAMLVEKQRQTDGMLEFWSDLTALFPGEMLPLRMTMRWHRRAKQVETGIAALEALCPDARTDLVQTEIMMLGLSELRAHEALDALMADAMIAFPDVRPIRMRYIQCLVQQSRYLDADKVASQIIGRDRMGASSQALLTRVAHRASIMRRYGLDREADVIGELARRMALRPRRPLDRSEIGQIAFFTGQLGTGGAERQMSRLASTLQNHAETGAPASGMKVKPPLVCVRHATPGRGDFFLPVLKDAGVQTSVLSDLPAEPMPELPDGLSDLLEILPEDLLVNTAKLIPWFEQNKVDVAYIWQDGGVLAAGLAALIAGVPRIVTSFRGLPPNLRPALSRAEMKPLYAALAEMPHVTFSSNSRKTAEAYEDWLELARGAIKVIPNAIPPVLPEGSPDDHAWWNRTLARSPACDKTVLGVFRFDTNKRPLFWIDCAAAHARRDPATRFVLVGSGHDHPACAERIRELELEDRIFLAGLRENVGFFMHRADLVMHLARMEGLPNVLIEAQLAGVPVLATPAGGTSEVVVDGRTGWILEDAEDPAQTDVCFALERMLSNPAELERMGQEAAGHAEPRFLIDKIIDRTVDLFLETRI